MRGTRETERGKMDDTISRQAVHDLIIETDPYWAEGMTRAIYDGVSKIPSVERRGRWINGKCSVCGGHGPIWAVSKGYYKSNFCPNCGARMEAKE